MHRGKYRLAAAWAAIAMAAGTVAAVAIPSSAAATDANVALSRERGHAAAGQARSGSARWPPRPG